MKVGGIILVVVAGLMLAGSAFFGIYSVKNTGSAERLASYSASRRSAEEVPDSSATQSRDLPRNPYRRLGALISYRIHRKAARQRNISIGLGLVGVLGLVGGIVMIKKGGKKGGGDKPAAATAIAEGATAQPAAASPAAAAAPMVAAAPAPAVAASQPLPPDNWYVGGDGQQQGPLALAQLQQSISSGQIDPRSYVFHASLGQWMPIANVPQLASALPPQQG